MPTDAGRLWTPDELLGPLKAEEARYAPKQLFASGHTEWLQRSPRVAIVGARKASDEGLRRAARLVRFLVKHDATIISGLAEGIDHCAHTTTLDAGGRTIAVVGNYPVLEEMGIERLQCLPWTIWSVPTKWSL
jgi:DNA processing protein